MKITELKLFYINEGKHTSFGTGRNANFLPLKVLARRDQGENEHPDRRRRADRE